MYIKNKILIILLVGLFSSTIGFAQVKSNIKKCKIINKTAYYVCIIIDSSVLYLEPRQIIYREFKWIKHLVKIRINIKNQSVYINKYILLDNCLIIGLK